MSTVEALSFPKDLYPCEFFQHTYRHQYKLQNQSMANLKY